MRPGDLVSLVATTAVSAAVYYVVTRELEKAEVRKAEAKEGDTQGPPERLLPIWEWTGRAWDFTGWAPVSSAPALARDMTRMGVSTGPGLRSVFVVGDA